MRASHTSGITASVDCLEILNVIRLVKDSPLAEYLSVTANWMHGGIADQYCVFVCDILQPIICHNISKSEGVILTKFWRQLHLLASYLPKDFLHSTFLHWESI